MLHWPEWSMHHQMQFRLKPVERANDIFLTKYDKRRLWARVTLCQLFADRKVYAGPDDPSGFVSGQGGETPSSTTSSGWRRERSGKHGSIPISSEGSERTGNAWRWSCMSWTGCFVMARGSVPGLNVRPRDLTGFRKRRPYRSRPHRRLLLPLQPWPGNVIICTRKTGYKQR